MKTIKKLLIAASVATLSTTAFGQFSNGGTANDYTMGKVGIGTSSINYGKLLISGEGVDQGLAIYQSGTTGGGTYRMYVKNSIGYLTRGGSDTKGIAINGSGYIGLGITNPTERLHVNGNAKITGAATINNLTINDKIVLDNTYTLSNCMGSGSAVQGEKTEITKGRIELTRHIVCGSTNTEQTGTTIIEGGRVEAKEGKFIKLSAPVSLKVASELVMTGSNRLKIGSDDGYMMMYNVPEHASSYLDYKGNLYFRHDNSYGKSALALQKDGTVVIGIYPNYGEKRVIDTKGNQLMVNGGIYCESIKVRNDVPKSDYVFEEDYDLKTIEEVEAFVKENKHLPEVPSAKQFEEEGYNVGEMDDLLLRKVEELTLYIVQLKKEINQLKDGE